LNSLDSSEIFLICRKLFTLYWSCRITFSYRRNNPGLEQAIIGTELLRLAGGPNRGWYPTRKANQPRPASIEHLERLNNAYDARLPGTGDQRKPLTLPTNITPNKYFGQSKHSSASSTREALRRVTSLLIKKGKRRGFALLERESTTPERSARGIVGKHDVVGDSETLTGPICIQDGFYGPIFFFFDSVIMNVQSNTLPMMQERWSANDMTSWFEVLENPVTC